MFNTNQIKVLAKKYGKITIYTYLGVSVVDLAGCMYLVSRGWDVKYISNKLGIKIDQEKLEKSFYFKYLGNFALAFLIHKSLIFIRVPATIAIVPILAKKFKI